MNFKNIIMCFLGQWTCPGCSRTYCKCTGICSECKIPVKNHFFGINKEYHENMYKELNSLNVLTSNNTLEDLYDNNKNIIINDNNIKNNIKKINENFKSLEGTGEKYKFIKHDIHPCSSHWPRFCENMVLHSNKNILKKLDDKGIKYVKVPPEYIIYAVANFPLDFKIIYN